jgi:transcriptional regulator with XRE-family HTH domain
MTQGELAESLGYPQNEFSRMLNAQTTPPADFIESLADALGIPPQTFLDYRLMVVEDALRAVPERVDELLEELSRGIELPPYFEWKVRPLADPRTMSLTDVAREIIEIVEAEGPVVGARVYRLRLAAAGIASETKELRSVLNRAAAAAVRSGRLLADNERDERTQKYLVLRAAGVEQVTPRARGDRSMLEVPLREIAEVVGMTNAHRRGGNVAEIQHEIFAAFGIAGSNIQILERVNTAIMWRKRG